MTLSARRQSSGVNVGAAFEEGEKPGDLEADERGVGVELVERRGAAGAGEAGLADLLEDRIGDAHFVGAARLRTVRLSGAP
jgi:hypothetical protein